MSTGLLRTHAIETLGRVGVAGITEIIGAVDQRVGSDRRPIVQIGGGFHHHGIVGGPQNIEAEAVRWPAHAKWEFDLTEKPFLPFQ